MRNWVKNVRVFACAAILAVAMVGCAQQGGGTSSSSSGDSSTSVTDSSSQVQESIHDDADPTANGRIDVTTKGEQVATYHGAKYIVSDATAEQTTDDLGVQEICVVNQPESWASIESIGWDRNSISYARIAMPWGFVSYRYEYVNESGAAEGMQGYSRVDANTYFQGMEGVQHMDLDGRDVAYVYEDMSDYLQTDGIEDLEAESMAADAADAESADGQTIEDVEGLIGRTVAVYAHEVRGDKCAFLVTATCFINDGAEFSQDAQQLLRDAYAPLHFAGKDEQVDAASYLANVTITDASGGISAMIKRAGSSLMSYTEHSASLLAGAELGSESPMMTTSYDLASTEEVPEDAQELEVAGRSARVQVNTETLEGDEVTIEENTLRAWVSLDGGTLFVQATMNDGEGATDALVRAMEKVEFGA